MAPPNIASMFVTRPVPTCLREITKTSCRIVLHKCVTDQMHVPTSQLPRGLLNVTASANIRFMSVTVPTFQLFKFEENDDAWLNMESIKTTRPTFQLFKLEEKVDAPLNMELINSACASYKERTMVSTISDRSKDLLRQTYMYSS